MARTLYVYEIKNRSRSFQPEQRVPLRPFDIVQGFYEEAAAELLSGKNASKTIRFVAAHSQEEANEEAQRENKTYELLAAIPLSEILEIMDISPGDIDPLNISSALNYARTQYSDELDQNESKCLETSANKIKSKLSKILDL